jgi:tRNA-modifying protein YgfZ
MWERLAAGTAYVEAAWMRVVSASGPDALAWLDDLVSADLAALDPGGAHPSLLLAPTGGIRAGFLAARLDDGVLLIQDDAQPSVGDLLSPYVLSSAVELRDRTDELAILSFPGLDAAPDVEGATAWSPSCLGAGSDLLCGRLDRQRVSAALTAFEAASSADAEAWRVAAGVPRVGIDTSDGDLPQEGALEAAVAFDKGCFVGQEAVAKTRNLGHPRRALLTVSAEGRVEAGDRVVADGDDVGAITSAVPAGPRSLALARVRWRDRERALRTEHGLELRPR